MIIYILAAPIAVTPLTDPGAPPVPTSIAHAVGVPVPAPRVHSPCRALVLHQPVPVPDSTVNPPLVPGIYFCLYSFRCKLIPTHRCWRMSTTGLYGHFNPDAVLCGNAVYEKRHIFFGNLYIKRVVKV